MNARGRGRLALLALLAVPLPAAGQVSLYSDGSGFLPDGTFLTSAGPSLPDATVTGADRSEPPDLLAWSTCPESAGSWHLDRGPSSVTFKIGHLVFSKVKGRFTRFSGSVRCPEEDFAKATVEAAIEVGSIYTGHQDRDQHLLTDDFFHAQRFPEIRFQSRSVSRTGEDTFEVVGDLTIRGITREIVLATEYLGRRATTRGERLDFRATGSLNRSDYGVSWNAPGAGRALLDETVEVSLGIALIEDR